MSSKDSLIFDNCPCSCSDKKGEHCCAMLESGTWTCIPWVTNYNSQGPKECETIANDDNQYTGKWAWCSSAPGPGPTPPPGPGPTPPQGPGPSGNYQCCYGSCGNNTSCNSSKAWCSLSAVNCTAGVRPGPGCGGIWCNNPGPVIKTCSGPGGMCVHGAPSCCPGLICDPYAAWCRATQRPVLDL